MPVAVLSRKIAAKFREALKKEKPSLFATIPGNVWQREWVSFCKLAFNMFALWMFGRHIERLWGTGPFVIYYFVCVVGAALTHLAFASMTAPGLPVVGASGGVFGLLLAFGMMYPNTIVVLLIPPIPMPAKYFVVFFGAVELWLGLTAPNSSMAHFAHLGGMAFGYALIQFWRGRLPLKPRYILRR